MASESGKHKVLLLYCGGTIAMERGERDDPLHPPERFEPFMEKARSFASQIADVDCVFITNKDSANINAEDWKQIAETIARGYDGYDGFVVVHGTDTMAYSAAVVSYILQNLNKPVVFTGSQKALIEDEAEGKGNLINSVKVACSDLAEVAICFNGTIWRGNKAVKVATKDLDAFGTPWLAPLGAVSEGKVEFNEHAIMRSRKGVPLELRTDVDDCLQIVVPNPFNATHILLNDAAERGARGILFAWDGEERDVEGENNLVTKAIKDAAEKGVPVVFTHLKAKETGENYEPRFAALVKAGAIPADMNYAPATAKLLWCLGQTRGMQGPEKTEQVRQMFLKEYAGENQVVERTNIRTGAPRTRLTA